MFMYQSFETVAPMGPGIGGAWLDLIDMFELEL